MVMKSWVKSFLGSFILLSVISLVGYYDYIKSQAYLNDPLWSLDKFTTGGFIRGNFYGDKLVVVETNLSRFSNEGSVVMLFSKRGELLGKFKTEFKVYSFVVANDTLFVSESKILDIKGSTVYTQNFVSAYSLDGKLLWRRNISAFALAYSNGRIFGIDKGNIFALDNSGNLLWKKTIEGNPYRMLSCEKLIIVSTENMKRYEVPAFSPSGNFLWKLENDVSALDTNCHYILMRGSNWYGLFDMNGNELWIKEVSPKNQVIFKKDGISFYNFYAHIDRNGNVYLSEADSFTILDTNGKVIAYYNMPIGYFQISPDGRLIFDEYHVFVNPLYDRDHDKIPDDEDVFPLNNELLHQLFSAFGISFIFASLYEWRKKKEGRKAHEEYLRLKRELERRI
ncbi:PQQ-like beta-propeller repeat protein [Thermococcus barophilus]|nr:PQQ-like beta-propeller repeat protein [Thermococcus barophilus]